MLEAIGKRLYMLRVNHAIQKELVLVKAVFVICTPSYVPFYGVTVAGFLMRMFFATNSVCHPSQAGGKMPGRPLDQNG